MQQPYALYSAPPPQVQTLEFRLSSTSQITATTQSQNDNRFRITATTPGGLPQFLGVRLRDEFVANPQPMPGGRAGQAFGQGVVPLGGRGSPGRNVPHPVPAAQNGAVTSRAPSLDRGSRNASRNRNDNPNIAPGSSTNAPLQSGPRPTAAPDDTPVSSVAQPGPRGNTLASTSGQPTQNRDPAEAARAAALARHSQSSGSGPTRAVSVERSAQLHNPSGPASPADSGRGRDTRPGDSSTKGPPAQVRLARSSTASLSGYVTAPTTQNNSRNTSASSAASQRAHSAGPSARPGSSAIAGKGKRSVNNEAPVRRWGPVVINNGLIRSADDSMRRTAQPPQTNTAERAPSIPRDRQSSRPPAGAVEKNRVLLERHLRPGGSR